MQRADRQVTDLQEIADIIRQCDVCRLGLNTPDGYPYILPLNFGYKWEGRQLTLYFHSALEGCKHELIRADNRASFEMDGGHSLRSDAGRGYCTMDYFSVMGRGVISYITDEAAKTEALTLLTDRYHTGHFDFNHAALPRTCVYKLTVTSLTAKRKSPPATTATTA